MDDPWGSPWATDDPSPIPTINLPAAPPPATLSSRSNSPRVSISSPWQQHDDDAAWGGWNEAKSGTSSPGWGRSPGLRPAVVRERDVSPGPWMGRKSEERGSDSAIGIERERKLSVPEAKDARKGEEQTPEKPPTKPEPEETEEAGASETESSTRSQSPDLSPPGPALRAEDRPEPVRSASKVQELVDMYDGIANSRGSPTQSAIVSPPPQKLTHTADEEDGQWSDVVTSPTLVSPTEALDESPSVEAPRSSVAETNGWPEDTTTEASAPASLPKRSKIPDIQYPVDLSHLDSLFLSTPPITVSPEPLPDTIIDDTFASISERKTWYRVSRFGSMRKHNTGNDENYSRIDWEHSAARDKSLRIVRRWMEEDSILGRVSLGARQKGAVGGSMFNWDSKAEPVDVGELLGRKKGHERGGSKGSRGSKGNMASPIGATFGWSSQTTSPTEPSFPKPFEPKVNGVTEAKTRPQSLIMPSKPGPMKPTESAAQLKTRPKSLIMPPAQAINRPSIDQALATSPPTASRISPQTISKPVESEDDDDDWGEMVSSPTVPVAGSFAATDAEASRLDKPVDQKITSPSAASFGWNEDHNLPKTSSVQPQSPLKTELQPSTASFGWGNFEQPPQNGEVSVEQPKAPLKAELQPIAAMSKWDDFEKPSDGGNSTLEQPKSPLKPDQPSTAMSGWDDFETPSQDAPKVAALAEAQSSSAATFEWDGFEKPSQEASKSFSKAELSTSAATFGVDEPPSVVPKDEPKDVPAAATDIWGSAVQKPTTSSASEKPTSPIISPTISQPSQAISLPNPVETLRPQLSQPKSPTPKTTTPSQTKKDEEIVAKILNDLPDLSYMLR